MNFSDIEADKQIDLMQQVIRNSPVAKVIINENLIITGLNKALADETKYHPKQLYGEHINKILKKENHEKHVQIFKEWFNDPEKKRLSPEKQLYLVCKDGHESKVRMDIYPLSIWDKNSMIQISDVKKPVLLGCIAIVIGD